MPVVMFAGGGIPGPALETQSAAAAVVGEVPDGS
jgi:hypothetical protein